jgi:DNA-binding GntR family transcriptional regulator
VPEKDLCALFGVSRTPLREALKVLAAERLVSLEPNRGAWVTSVTPEDVREVYPVMGALEGLAAELACDRMTDDEARNLRSLHDQMIDAYRAGSRDAFFRFNQAIHEAILDAARNATLTEQYHGLAARVRQARYVARMTDAQWARAVDEHEAMIRCIETRDGPELARILRLHLRHKAETVLAWVNKAGTGGSPETPE